MHTDLRSQKHKSGARKLRSQKHSAVKNTNQVPEKTPHSFSTLWLAVADSLAHKPNERRASASLSARECRRRCESRPAEAWLQTPPASGTQAARAH